MKEINLVCMSGQGSVQATETLAKAFYAEHGMHVSSKVIPGARSKCSAVVSYLKVDAQPIHSVGSNQHPSAVIMFWDGLFNIAAQRGHQAVVDAVGRLQSGLLLVNSELAPDQLAVPFVFSGTLATVDANRITRKLLRMSSPPVGICLVGAYAALTGDVSLDTIRDVIMERFPGRIGEQNLACVREAAETVQVIRDYVSPSRAAAPVWEPADPDQMTEWMPIQHDKMLGLSQGGPAVWRTEIPVCDDALCQCKDTCLAEVICPDNTGFIVRQGLPHQGYRIDVDYCRGCALCAEVCVYHALKMVPDRQVLRENPSYAGISVIPFLNDATR